MITKLKEVRQKRGITQEELAKKSGVLKTTILDLEDGKIKNVSASTIVNLSKVLNCRVSDIFYI